MAGEMSWDEEGLLRLLDALLDQRTSTTDDDFLQSLLWSVPEDVTNLDTAALDRAYDEAFDRAFAVARRARVQARKDQERRARALTLLSSPSDRCRPLWRYRGWPLSTAYLDLSFGTRHRDPREMLALAEEACYHAMEILPKDQTRGPVFDLRAKAWAELANAHRVNDRINDAEAALDRAVAYLAEGSGDVALLARVRVVEANLRLHQRRLQEALDGLQDAHQLYMEIQDHHLAGRTLVSLSRVYQAKGEPDKAVPLLEEAIPLLDGQREPSLTSTALQVLIDNLVECREFQRAGELLLGSGLREAFRNEPLNQLRLRWVEAKIHAGMDRLDRADTIFQEVRAGLQQHGLEYDRALAGLELAAVWLRQGEAGRLLPLAIEMSSTFARLDLPTKEALAAVTFLKLACRKRAATLGFVERTREFLMRFQTDPALKFAPESVLLG